VRSLLAALVLLGASSGLARAQALRAARQFYVPVFIYHHVKNLKPADNATERGLTILPSQFRAQLQYVKGHGYHTISAAALTAALLGKGKLPSKPVVLTFDDGYRDMYTNVYPLLQRLHMVATFFVVPGFLGTTRYLTWKQVEDMSRHGMDVEAHTMTHPDLTLVSAAQARDEIARSRQLLQSRLHTAVQVFAYPYGDYNAAVLRDVRVTGYSAAFTTHQGWIESSAGMLTLPRVYANHDDTVPVTPALVHPYP
jgi:peptidoglycan/xylan/chitin deacetylase (PgdA/CDA1 family)